MTDLAEMWVLAGLTVGWLAAAFLRTGGYGLLVDMGLGVGGALMLGGIAVLLTGVTIGIPGMWLVGLFAACTAIVVQRMWWARR